MDASVANVPEVKQLSACRSTDQSSADRARARECLLSISQGDASGLRTIPLSESFDEGASKVGQTDADQEDEFRQKLIAISYFVEQQNEHQSAVKADAKMTAEGHVLAE